MRETCCPAPLARSAHWRRIVPGLLMIACATLGAARDARAQLSFLPFAAKKDPHQATSSRAARQDAVKSVPWDQLDERSTDQVHRVLDDVAIYRRLATQSIECDYGLYRHLVENPDLIVRMWEALGISSVALERQANGTFLANDGEGTRGRVEVLYASPEMHVVYAAGKYEGPMFHRPVRGQSVLILRSHYFPDSPESQRIQCQLDVFVRLEHAGVEMLAKTFQPLVGRVADHNFKETTAFMASLSYTAAVNPPKVARITGRIDRVPAAAKAQLIQQCDRISVEASLARNGAASTPGEPASLRQEVRATDRVQR